MASRLDNASGRGVPHPPSASVAPGFVLNARMPRPSWRGWSMESRQ